MALTILIASVLANAFLGDSVLTGRDFGTTLLKRLVSLIQGVADIDSWVALVSGAIALAIYIIRRLASG